MPSVKIVVAVDLEHKSADRAVVREAILLARTHGAGVEMVYVIPDPQNSFVQNYIPVEMQKRVQTDAEAELAAFAGEFDWQGIPHNDIVLRGVVYDALVEHCATADVRFIVIGASRPGRPHFFIGPNAARVARHAHCSVLVVRP